MGKIVVNAGMAEIDGNRLIVNNPLSINVGGLNLHAPNSIGTKEEEEIKKQVIEDKQNAQNIVPDGIFDSISEKDSTEKEEKEEEKEKEVQEQEKEQPNAPDISEQESNVLDGEDDMII